MIDKTGSGVSIGPHIPLLRRYARALTGSQQSGDIFVRMTLETILAEPARLASAHAPRVELYRLFHAIWETVAEPAALRPASGAADATRLALGDGLLQQLPPTRREAFLLHALEGFSPAEAAQILELSGDDVRNHIAAARLAMTSDTARRIIIVEDEAVIAMHLQDIVEDMGHEIVGIASTHREAVALAARHRADLVLADVCLADGSSGIEAVAEIVAGSPVPVIFITAFPERLLTGDGVEPTYLVAKPFDADTVIAAVGQALFAQRELSASANGGHPPTAALAG